MLRKVDVNKQVHPEFSVLGLASVCDHVAGERAACAQVGGRLLGKVASRSAAGLWAGLQWAAGRLAVSRWADGQIGSRSE